MYAPPADRTSPLLAQLARLLDERSGSPQTPFQAELAAARNEVAHFGLGTAKAARSGSAGLTRRTRLQAVG